MNTVLPNTAPGATNPEGTPPESQSFSQAPGGCCAGGNPGANGESLAKKVEPLLRTVNLSKTFRSRGLFSRGQGGVRALDRIDLTIMPGQIMGLVGESGSGKTTLGKAIMRLIRADEGEVYFKGTNVLRMNNRAMKVFRHQTQMLFQNPSSTLHPKMTIGKMLQESLTIHRGLNDKGELREGAESLLEKVSLGGRYQAYPDELSGGQKRRVGIARVLAANPELLVADEPTSGLDALLRAEIIDLLQEVKEAHQSYLLISHDLNVVQRACDLVAVMFHGRIVELLPKETINDEYHHPYTTELFNAAARLRGNIAKVQDLSTSETKVEATTGCAYLGRCKLAAGDRALAQKCAETKPRLVPIGPNQLAACHALTNRDNGATDTSPGHAVEA